MPDGDDPSRAEASVKGQPQAAVKEPVWTRSQALRTKAYWFLVLGFMFISLPAGTLFIHMVPYFQDKGLSPASAASALSTYALGVLAGRAVWGYTVTRLGIHYSLVAIGISYGAAVFMFNLASGAPAIFASNFILGITIGGVQQIQAQAWPDYFGRNIVGALTGFSTVMMAPVHGVGPLLAAFMYDATKSYFALYSFFAILSFVAGLFFFLARRPTPPVQKEASVS